MKINNNVIGKGSSGAKMILIGEHAVVYNNPAIAMPFNGLKTDVTIYKTNGSLTIDSLYYKGDLYDGSEIVNGIVKLIDYVLNVLNKPKKDLHFIIRSNIIAQRGLGSSAAVSIAIIRALYNAFNVNLSNELLIKHAMFAEKIHHTNPSGIDVNVLVYQKPIWFERNKGFKFIDINFNGTMMIIDSGIASQTKFAVEHVGKLYNDKTKMVKDNFKVLNDLTKLALASLKEDDAYALGVIMNKAQVALTNIEVSSKILNSISKKSLNLGALGAKLTGGGVGGCIIALTKTTKEAENIKKQLLKDGISNVWISPLNKLS